MHYVCIENNIVVSILNYAPNVPTSVSVVEISNEQADQLVAQTHYFDVPSRTVKPVAASVTEQKARDAANAIERGKGLILKYRPCFSKISLALKCFTTSKKVLILTCSVLLDIVIF